MTALHKFSDLVRRIRQRRNEPPIADIKQASQIEPQAKPADPNQLASDAFNHKYYAENNPELVTDGIDLFEHYMTKGWKEGRNPNSEFNTVYYLSRYQDVKEAGINPFVHWLIAGKKEGRQSLSVNDLAFEAFDFDYYAQNNLDLVNKEIDLFEHFMTKGWTEGRSPSAEFNTTFYLTSYPDVKNAAINPFVHWLKEGKREGRRSSPVDPANLKSIFNIQSDTQISSESRNLLQSLGDWWLSEDRNSLVDDAIDIDPEIGSFELSMPTLYPPLYDKDYIYIKQMLEMLNSSRYNCIILVPFGKLGGADFVSGILSKSLQRLRSTLIIRTDSSEWERPDWYHHEVSSLDLSGFFKAIHSKVRALYTILTALNPDHIFNVNSRLGFELFRDYGRQLSSCHRLHCYYFCSDLDQRGNEGGYPVHFFRQVLPFLATAMIDSRYLMDKLVNRYSLPANQQRKLHLVYSPCSELDQSISQLPVVEEQIRTQFQRPRPIILWAGRLDKQKRFDLVIEIAKRMSDVDFLVWGKAVLDDPPDLSELPGNITINKPFIDYSELPLANADGWLYTSGWDGIPTILIKIGSLGMPIVASAVGGIPEILSNDNGWPVDAIDDPDSYVFQLTALLTDQVQRRLRASKLREHILSQHSLHAYQSNIFQLLS